MRTKRALPISRAIRSCTTVILGHCVLVHVFRLWRTFAHTQVCHLLKSIYSLKDKTVCLNSAFWNCSLKNRLLQFANNTGQLFSTCWCAWYTRDSICLTWAHGLMCDVFTQIYYVYIYISIFPTAATGFWTLNLDFHQVFFVYSIPHLPFSRLVNYWCTQTVEVSHFYVRRCEKMWEDVSGGVRRCEKMWVEVWEDVRRCEDEKMRRWEDVKMRRWGEDVRMRRCEDEKMWRWEDVKMRRCEDEKMRGWEDVKMRRCEDEKMWGWEDVRMRRCEDEKMWRWEGVKMRRCEDEKMWRWEDVLQTPTIGRILRLDALAKKLT